jgi:signal transduction histidine kinase
MKRLGCLWLIWLISVVVRAQPREQPIQVTLRPGDPAGEIPLQGQLYQFVDSTGQLTIQQIRECQRTGQFRRSPSQTNRQDFGYTTTATHWLFFELTAPAGASPLTQLLLEAEYANLDELELIEVATGPQSADSVRSLGLTGDRFVFSQRPYRNNNYVFPIRLRVGQTVQYYLRLKHPHAILSFFVSLWSRPAFLVSDRTEYFLWGIYIGVICTVMIVNLVMLFALRDSIYLWYSLYIHFITMHVFTDAGLSFQYLWPNLPRLNAFLPVYLYVWAAMVAQTTFMQYFIHQTRQNSRIFRWLKWFKGAVLLALAAAIAINLLDDIPACRLVRDLHLYRALALATSWFVPVIAVLTILSLYEANRRSQERDVMVRYYGYALAVQFAGYGLVAFMNFCQTQGWPLPFDVETYVILALTVLADLVFFTFGLTYRYRHAQQGNQRLELNLLQSRQDAQQQVIFSLEDERRRLAQDLHDDVGPLLSTAKGYVSRLARDNPAPSLQRAQTLLDEAADELRTLSHQLLPNQLDQTGLIDAIDETVRKLTHRGVPIQFVYLGQVRSMGRQAEQLLFSLATQLIRNALTHAQATEVTVQLLYHPEEVTLSVEDNGRPANHHVAEEANLRTKVELLKAELLIDATDEGNSVMLRVPIVTPVPA